MTQIKADQFTQMLVSSAIMSQIGQRTNVDEAWTAGCDPSPPFVKEKRRPEDRRYRSCRLTALFFLFAAGRNDVFEMLAGDAR